MVLSDIPDAETPLTPAARVLLRHRDQLEALLRQAEVAEAADSTSLKRQVSNLVDELAEDLIRLYALAERGTLCKSDHLVVLPALERLRNALRFWQHRRRPLRDTLHRAIGVIGVEAP